MTWPTRRRAARRWRASRWTRPAADLARVFKALADPVRLRLLSLIASHAGGEACVCDLTGASTLPQPTISHHLQVLREAGLIDCERRGTWVYYWVLPRGPGPAVVAAARCSHRQHRVGEPRRDVRCGAGAAG